jgi:hypothetical protein
MSMKHEELCSIVNDPSGVDNWGECQCLLIERVRNETIDECIDVIYNDCKHTKVLGCEPCTQPSGLGVLPVMLRPVKVSVPGLAVAALKAASEV